MESWLQVSIKVTHEAVEAVADLLREVGARNGVEIEDPLLLNQLRESATWELCDIPHQENTEVVTVSAYYPETTSSSRNWMPLNRASRPSKAGSGSSGSGPPCSGRSAKRTGPTLGSSISTPPKWGRKS